MKRRLARLAVASTLGLGFTAGSAFAGPPTTHPGQGTSHAPKPGAHCHIVNPANAPFVVTNPSPHAGGHAHQAPFTATPCP
jgi:hypothetical protein